MDGLAVVWLPSPAQGAYLGDEHASMIERLQVLGKVMSPKHQVIDLAEFF